MANTKITNPELFNLGDSTSATQLPVMTTAQRIAMNAPPSLTVDYLVVAGGGGGGAGYTASTVGTGGGGGAGGLITNYDGTSLSLNTSTAYAITVGDGGNGGAPGGNSFNGGDSTFSGTGITTIQAAGGGRGGMYNNSNIGGSGGSGGGTGYSGGFAAGGSGNTPSTTPSQGNNGGDYYEASPYGGSGGGGAGSAGSDGPTNVDGGSGVTNSITGTSVFYAAGGGGGKPGTSGTQAGGSGIGGDGGNANSLNGTSGATNTGSGGGGAGHPFASGNNSGTAGNGGSGIVILRYPTADVASYTATGLTLTETTDGVDTVLSFTTVGTGTITFTSSTPTNTISTGEMIFNSDTDKVEYFDGTKWYGITYEVPGPFPVGGTWDPTNSITSPCATGSGALNFSNNNRLATETGAGYYVAAFSTVKVGDFWFFGTDAGGNPVKFEGNFDAADQVYTPTDLGTYIEIKYFSPDLQLGITKTRICPYSATWYSNTIRWYTWASSIRRYNDTPFTTAPSIAVNDIIGMLVDVNTNTVKFYKNNVLVTTQAL